MFTIIKLAIAILIGFKIIPKAKLMSIHDIALLEEEFAQEKRKVAATTKKNILKTKELVTIRRNYYDLEKQYQAIFLLEHEGQTLIKKQAAQINAYEKDLDIANDEFNALQDELTTATDLSKRLKEALIRWTS